MSILIVLTLLLYMEEITMAKSKPKGSNYELKTAKRLTDWWGEPFHRTPGSGSWSSTHNSDHQAGDIIAPIHSKFPFVVECKNQEKWSGDDIIFNAGKYPKFWEQVVTDARRVKKVPMLIAHRNYSRDYCTVPYSKHLTSLLYNKGIPHSISMVQYTDEMLEEDHRFLILTLEFQQFTELLNKETILENIHLWFPDWVDSEEV